MKFSPLQLLRRTAGALRDFVFLLKDAAIAWFNRDPFRNSTVVSYYTIIALPGLLVILINFGGYFLGKERIANAIHDYVLEDLGQEAARGVQMIINNSDQLERFTLSSLISAATLIFGATGVFFQLQKSLNIVWGVEPKPKKMWLKFIKDRAFSFGLILGVGFVLLASLILSTFVSLLSTWINSYYALPLGAVFFSLDIAISLIAITILFAAIFKILPDINIAWREVWAGAVLTAVLFVLAKFALSLYFGQARPASAYGAAGSIVLIMLWVNYSSMLVMFGAEFTRVLSEHRGNRVSTEDFAEWKDDDNPS